MLDGHRSGPASRAHVAAIVRLDVLARTSFTIDYGTLSLTCQRVGFDFERNELGWSR